MSNSVRPQRQQPTRLPHPWDSPGKNTGVGCHFLLQCMQVKSEREVAQSYPTLSDPMDCSPPGSPVHRIFQTRVLERGATAFSPGGANGKESVCQCSRCKRPRFDPCVGNIPWRRKWQLIPVFLSGKSHGLRNLVGFGPWHYKRVEHNLATKPPLYIMQYLRSSIV